MRMSARKQVELEQTPTVTPLCESDPPRFASDALGGRTTLTLVDAHRVEQDVQRALHAVPGAHFGSLVVRRLPDGVCLQGNVEFDLQACDLSEVARGVTGVDTVVNHIVDRSVRPVMPR